MPPADDPFVADVRNESRNAGAGFDRRIGVMGDSE
jgi:hypothetical protein